MCYNDFVKDEKKRYKFLTEFAICTLYAIYPDGCDMLPMQRGERNNMLKIKIISVGKVKNKDLKKVIEEYEKRLSKYLKLEIIEINDVFVCEKPSQAEIDMVLKKEANEILKKIDSKSYIVSMCIEGKKLKSEDLAVCLSDITHKYSEITFIIGSSHGISDEIKKISNLKLSMSDMTFPHNIAKLMLTEQIYRAFKILSNESYHK